MKRSITPRFAAVVLIYAAAVTNSFGQGIISRSSDGRYQIRPSYYADPYDIPLKLFHLSIFDTKTRKTIFVHQARYDVRYGMDELVLWHPSLPILAIRVHDSRRYSHTEIYALEGRRFTALEVPDYQNSALEKVDATRPFNVMFDRLDSWHGSELLLDLEFNACEKGSHDYAGSYAGKVALRVQHAGTTPHVQLHSVTVKPD